MASVRTVLANMTASDWTVLAVGLGATAASIASAVIAALSAGRSQRDSSRAATEADRLLAVEARIDERRYAVYKPMIEQLHAILLDPLREPSAEEKERARRMATDFGTWIGVFGSDEMLRAYHNWCQGYVFPATLAAAPPPWSVVHRLCVDLLLAARRDIGRSDTSTTRQELLGLRLMDLYAARSASGDLDALSAVTLPLDEVFDRAGWQPSWQKRFPELSQQSPVPPPSLTKRRWKVR